MTKWYTLDNNYLYISHLDQDYQFWILPTEPESINDSKSASFQPSTPLGRSAPIYSYSGSGARSVQVSLALHRDMMDDVNMNISNAKLGVGEDYVDNFIRAIQSIALPKYNLTNKAVEPATVALRLGKEFFIKGIVDGSIGVQYDKPILSNGRWAKVNVSFNITEVDPYDASTVFKNGSYRGEVQTLKKGASKYLNID